MAVGKEIRNQIGSVKNTQKITKAMQLVAASKMRKAQDRMEASKPYAEKIRAIVGHLSQAHSEYHHPYLQEIADEDDLSDTEEVFSDAEETLKGTHVAEGDILAQLENNVRVTRILNVHLPKQRPGLLISFEGFGRLALTFIDLSELT